MSKVDAISIAKKRELWAYIKRFGESWGEDRVELESYAKAVYGAYSGDIEMAITCFKGLICQSELINRKGRLLKP